MHHLLYCTHLWGINNSNIHLNPRYRNKADLETGETAVLLKIDSTLDMIKRLSCQSEHVFTKEQQNVILRLA